MVAYRDALDRSRAGMSPEEIHKQKCARKHAAHLERKKQNILAAEQVAKKKPTPEEQLKRLDARLGKGVGAMAERGRLHGLIVMRAAPKAKEETAKEKQAKEKHESKDPRRGRRDRKPHIVQG